MSRPGHGQPGERGSAECDCGRPKAAGAVACARCLVLDGAPASAEARIIIGLRALGGEANTQELMGELGLSQRQVLRAIERLKAAGRVQRIVTATEAHALQPTFVLLAVHALVEHVWGQLVLGDAVLRPTTAPWVATCRHAVMEDVRTAGGRVLARRCLRCGQAWPATRRGGVVPHDGGR